MTFTRRNTLLLVGAGLGTAALPRFALADAAPVDAATVKAAWTYLIARALVVRQEILDRGADGFAFNRISYNPLGSADFVNPNFDVAYLEAWVAVDDQSYAILEVPKVEGRYYTAQILDEWGEVIANINERTFPNQPYGKYALIKPGTNPDLPAGMGRIELHSSKAKILGRVELQTDPEGAVALQRQFTLTSSGTPVIADPAPVPMFDNEALAGLALFENAEAILASALDVAPNAAEMQQRVLAVAGHIASGAAGRAEVEAALSTIIPEFIRESVTKSAPYLNHWLAVLTGGNYGSDYFARAAANYAGIWANTTHEVIYLIATRDSNEAPLDGGQSYVMHFAADALPEQVVNAYWSVILVGLPDYRVVDNPLKRYNLNNYSALAKEADGSLKIAVGPRPVDGVPESNWLPSAEGKPFSLTFRTYVPKLDVREGRWQPAALVRLH